MEVRIPTLVLEIPDEQASVKVFEEMFGAALRRMVDAGWQAFVWAVENMAVSQHPAGDLRVKDREERKLLTGMGLVRFSRRRFTSPNDEKSFLLFDKRVGLRSNQRSTEAAERLLAVGVHGAQRGRRGRCGRRLRSGARGRRELTLLPFTRRACAGSWTNAVGGRAGGGIVGGGGVGGGHAARPHL